MRKKAPSDPKRYAARAFHHARGIPATLVLFFFNVGKEVGEQYKRKISVKEPWFASH
jgi:hypothetical protein